MVNMPVDGDSRFHSILTYNDYNTVWNRDINAAHNNMPLLPYLSTASIAPPPFVVLMLLLLLLRLLLLLLVLLLFLFFNDVTKHINLTDFFDLPSDISFKRYLLHLKTKGITLEEKNWKSYRHWYLRDADYALSKEGICDNRRRSTMLKASTDAVKAMKTDDLKSTLKDISTERSITINKYPANNLTNNVTGGVQLTAFSSQMSLPQPLEQQQQPLEQQQQEHDQISDEIDLENIVAHQPDHRALLFAWAYLLETGNKEGLRDFMELNDHGIQHLAAALPASLGERLDQGATKLLMRHTDLDKEDLVLVRLLLSRIVNTMSSSLARKTSKVIGRDVYENLVSLRATRLSREPLDKPTEESLDTIIDLCIEKGSVAAEIAICGIKSRLLEQDPKSSHLIAVKALEYVVTHMEVWAKVEKTSEAAHYGRFCCLFEVIFMDTDIRMTSGDTTSTTTKAFRMINERDFGTPTKDSVCGWKIDGIIGYKDLELCLSECKPMSASPFTALKQQTKNLRSNGRIHHHLKLFSDPNEEVEVYGLDWHGNNGVMYVLCDIDDALVASKVGNLTIPTECYDLGSFKETIALLFDLKKHLQSLLRKYRPRQLQRKRDIARAFDDSSPPSTPPSMYQATNDPAIFFSPAKRRSF
ncbi:hypothetical protein [Absidia glauca]|uniref:Uncharacterized protein n=1 Tax=Absidia glauca TaxID=4829 RepID=A0A168NRK7_ABSGL|nr:hypothetical protein [Absidia glauca]